jgi:hypothetical protein
MNLASFKETKKRFWRRGFVAGFSSLKTFLETIPSHSKLEAGGIIDIQVQKSYYYLQQIPILRTTTFGWCGHGEVLCMY